MVSKTREWAAAFLELSTHTALANPPTKLGEYGKSPQDESTKGNQVTVTVVQAVLRISGSGSTSHVFKSHHESKGSVP